MSFDFGSQCWFVVGPTASGKTRVAIDLAQRLNGEILSLDSMAVYREMDIGTAKPDEDERAAAAHHLIDLVSPTEDFSVSQYLDLATATVEQIQQRGKTPIFAGGTPLYLTALLRGLEVGPEANWEIRNRLEEEAKEHGSAWLHARLTEVDPKAAAKFHPHDTRRIVRALEFFETQGKAISDHQKHFDSGRSAAECRVFVLDWPRDQLHARINVRCEAMYSSGLLDEVRSLIDRYGKLGRTAAQAIGYQEAAELLAGKLSQPEAIARTQARSRQLARRQLIWYRRLSECQMVPVSGDLDTADVARRIEERAAI